MQLKTGLHFKYEINMRAVTHKCTESVICVDFQLQQLCFSSETAPSLYRTQIIFLQIRKTRQRDGS